MSIRGIGHDWTKLQPRNVPVLFGGGGYHDEGQTGLVNTGGANTQRAESIAIEQGKTERALDLPAENRNVESVANANPEFDNRQFKTGMDGDDAVNRVQLTTVQDGVASGDYYMKVDPRSDVYDQTLSVLGDIHGALHNTKEDVDMDASSKPVAGGTNPFGGNKHIDVIDDSGREYKQPTEEYIYDNAKPSLNPQQQKHINDNAATGLRRVNVKANTGSLMERMASKKAMMSGYQKFSESITEEMGQHNKPFVGNDDRERLLRPTRFEGADFVATQMGVANLSKSQALKHHRSKHTSKLSSAVVGS